MSTRHIMRKIREVLRLKNEQGCSQRQIQAATGLSKGSVGEYLRRAERAGMDWPAVEPLSDAELEARLFKQIGRNEPLGRTSIDFTWVHKELRRTGVTLQQLCIEYQQAAVDAQDGRRPYQYSQFCDLYTVGGAGSICRCGRRIAPARRASSITRARSPRSPTRRRAR